jgi:hypothetical protein
VVVVRSDEARGVWIVDSLKGERAAFVLPVLERPTRLGTADIPGALRPPLALAALALGGLGVALALLLRGRRSALPEDLGLCKNALPLAEGTLLFDDDTPELPIPAGASVGTDPVVAIFDRPVASFRDHAQPRVVRVVPGTLADHRILADLSPYAAALALLAITAAPLAAALALLG